MTKLLYSRFTGSPGLVVIGDGSCSRGRGFESDAIYWMDVTFYHIDLS